MNYFNHKYQIFISTYTILLLIYAATGFFKPFANIYSYKFLLLGIGIQHLLYSYNAYKINKKGTFISYICGSLFFMAISTFS